jgi:hypothetical protein
MTIYGARRERRIFPVKHISFEEIECDINAFSAKLKKCGEMVLIENDIEIARLLSTNQVMSQQNLTSLQMFKNLNLMEKRNVS